MSKERTILTNFETRQSFIDTLRNNSPFMIKFGADWCVPCQKINDYVHEKFLALPNNVLCADVNVDDSFDLYAFLKQKKMVTGIPTILFYDKGATSYPPDESVSGTDIEELNAFFNRCLQRLT